MSSASDRLLQPGKLPHALLAELLGELPPPPPEVRLGPRIGEDACGIDVTEGTLVVSADPITLTAEDAARLSVLVGANDVAVCGARPRWFLAVVLVPLRTAESVVRNLFDALQSASAELGVTLVGGHTEVTAAVNRPVVIGQMLGLVERGAIVTTGGFDSGDVVVQVRPAPIEGAAVLGREAADRLRDVDAGLLAEAQGALDSPGISIVETSLLAAELGAKALHDPTEGGLTEGLYEMAAAAGVAIRINREEVLWYEPGLVVCSALGCDPWSTLASGTLLAAFPTEAADSIVTSFGERGQTAAVIGAAEPGTGVRDLDGRALRRPGRDEVARVLAGD